MKGVLRFFVRLWHALFRGFESKVSTVAVCPDTENAGTEHWTMNKLLMAADPQKRGCNGKISRYFKRKLLILNELRAILEQLSQVFDFLAVMAVFHDFSPVFHSLFQTEELDFYSVTEITWFGRTPVRGEKLFLGSNNQHIVGINQRNCS